MKNIIIMFVFGVLTQQVTQAQGTTYLSNLSQTSDGNIAVGSNSWLAGGFKTGTNVGGYMLNSIQLGMADASGNPSGFTVMIYSAIFFTGSNPGSNLGTLDGSLSPVTAGTYTYTPASSLTLSPSTSYFIVLTAGTAIANGAYEWNFMSTLSYNPSGGWGGQVVFGNLVMVQLGITIRAALNLPSTPQPFPNLRLKFCWAWAAWPSSGIAAKQRRFNFSLKAPADFGLLWSNQNPPFVFKWPM